MKSPKMQQCGRAASFPTQKKSFVPPGELLRDHWIHFWNSTQLASIFSTFHLSYNHSPYTIVSVTNDKWSFVKGTLDAFFKKKKIGAQSREYHFYKGLWKIMGQNGKSSYLEKKEFSILYIHSWWNRLIAKCFDISFRSYRQMMPKLFRWISASRQTNIFKKPAFSVSIHQQLARVTFLTFYVLKISFE